MRRPWPCAPWCLTSLLLLASACNARVSEGAEETGGEDGLDVELLQACADGCMAFVSCYPEGYESIYPDDDCEATCEEQYDGCASEAIAYATCATELECSAWPDLIADPALTTCADAWSTLASCMSMTPEPDP